MKLLEREVQLGELQAALERAESGRGGDRARGRGGRDREDLAVAGVRGAGSRQGRVLLGTCEDLLTPRALGPSRDMAREEGGALGGVRGEDRDAFIGGLMPEMRFAQRPAVVIVEDAHWADDASLDIIRHLARRIGRLPAMLVVSYRDEELTDDHPFRRIIGALAGPAVLHLELAGLSDATVGRVAADSGLAPGPVAAAVGGNPFYLSEVLAAPGLEVPPSVRHAVWGRVASLPGTCQSALERLAVVPAEAELWLAEALLPDPAVLEPAERRGILVASQHRIRFRHERARRAVEFSLPSLRRIEHHRRVLGTLAAAGAEPSRLVHHAVAAGDEQAVARYAPRRPRPPQPRGTVRPPPSPGWRWSAAPGWTGSRWPGCTGWPARALYALNRFGEAAQHADRAVEIWDAHGSTPLELGETLLISARMSTLTADPAAGRAKALRALDVLEPLGPSHTLALPRTTWPWS